MRTIDTVIESFVIKSSNIPIVAKITSEQTNGSPSLKILERFANRSDIEILLIDEDKRKDVNERKRLINESDYTSQL